MNQDRTGARIHLPSFGTGVRKLIIAFVTAQVFFLLITQWEIFGGDMARLAANNIPLMAGLPSGPLSGRIWQVFTYMWIHDTQSLWHLAFNILVLYFFGPLFEKSWGTRDFLRFFFLCGIGGGVFTVFAALLFPGLFAAIVIGASAAMLGLIVAFGMRYPNEEILLFFIIPIPGRYIVPITLVADLLVWLSGSPVAISAHWGGMLTAYLLITGNWRPWKLKQTLKELRDRRRRKRKKPVPFDVVDGGKSGGPWIN